MRSDVYENDFRNSDALLAYGYVDWTRRLGDQTSLSLRASDDHTWIGYESLRNSVSLRPELQHRVGKRFVVEAAYGFTWSGYRTHTTPVADRDGVSHSGTVTGTLDFGDTGVRGYIAFSHVSGDTDGDDYDHDANSVTVGLRVPMPLSSRLDIAYTRTHDDYDHENSATAFTRQREDVVDNVSARLTVPVSSRVSLQAGYGHTDNESNIRFFDYEQHVYSAGMTIRW